MTEDQIRLREGRALLIGMWGNLFMGAAGVVAAILSHSDAILVDGLFSLIGFTSALLGRRVSATVHAGPDRLRPFGYAADEAIFATFRALSLLGLVLFAMSGAAMNIYGYLTGDPPVPLKFGPLIVYFVLIGLTCALLWFIHRRAWKRTGESSDILRMEATAAAFDGIITAAAGVGMAGIYFLQDTALSVITPVGDSIIVLLLCSTVIARYISDFRRGLAELAGVTAAPEHIATTRRAARAALGEDGGRLNDLSVTKLGRSFQVAVYYDPGRPVLAQEIDTLNLRLQHDISAALPGADVILLATACGRSWPATMDPRSNPRP
ncbi:cation transporter [Ruegeria sp. HKCCD8929]|uniref:cation transporter n=1 Tax=Ruegeria sp. HKCCD8929 TaxID=2683006 RepID=UPI00148A0088|nr:cation transporter [Ruegeria sp. HKCCD8929]